MNPLTKVKLINELNEREVQLGVADNVSWHSEYKDSSWIFLGGLPYELSEGDIICVFSQYGEVVNINLVRDKKTGKSKGFCFLCYEDQRSTVLAVDNFNGIKIKGRIIRVDHVSNYRAPKDSNELDNVTKELQEKGCGAHTPPPSSSESMDDGNVTKHKKEEKEKKKRKEAKETTDQEALTELPSSSSPRSKMIKEEADLKKHSIKSAEKGQKAQSKDSRKHYPSSPEDKTPGCDGAADLERDSKKERRKHEHKSSSRKEAREERHWKQDRCRRSSDTHSSWHNGGSEGHSHRNRSPSHDRAHMHKKAQHSWKWDQDREQSRDKGKERDRDQEFDRNRERDRDREFHRDRERDRDWEFDKDRERD